MEKLKGLKEIMEFVGSGLLIICGLIIIIKLLIQKYDKNKNNKLENEEKEEMLKDNYNYVMSFLTDSLKCIAKGIVNDTGCKLVTAEKLILKSVNDLTKTNDELQKEIDEERKTIEEYEEKIKADLALQAEMKRKEKLEKEIETLKTKLKGETNTSE